MSNSNITIGLTGDVMIGRNVNDMINREGYQYPWGNVLPLLKNTDFNLINLETALTNSSKKVYKTFNFKAAPDKIKTLTEAEIDVVNIANNHILDFSEEGLIETIQTLKNGKIQYLGAGMNDKEAQKPIVLSVKNITLGILGFTDNEPGWKAGPSSSGVNYINISHNKDREMALKAIEKLSQKTDIVIVSIHWGPNMNEEPYTHFVEFAHEMIDHGADIVHGHSAHNFQGMEIYNQKLILYDVGDFVDDYVVDPYFRNDHSFFFQVQLSKERIEKLTLIPVLISKNQVNLATGKDYDWGLQRMRQLSEKLGTEINDKAEVLL